VLDPVRDKTVRRRRAVLALLVVLSLILLTAYFGESPGGRLHAVQRGFMTIISPLQDGANKVLKPVRGAIGGVGDLFNAAEERDQLRRKVAKLTHELAAHEVEQREYGELVKLYRLDNRLNISDYRQVSAGVVSAPADIWNAAVVIDQGTAAGVRVEDAVVNGEGLVGKVTQVGSQAAQVSLLTDSVVGVSVRIAGTDISGIVQAKVGDPTELVMRYMQPANAQVTAGEQVITSGTIAPAESLYPRGIPVGEVTSINEESAYTTVNVRPAVNFKGLEQVQVLTDTTGRASTLEHLIGTLSPGQPSTGGTTGQLASTGGG
jgi:rod shape-determining protein MreC